MNVYKYRSGEVNFERDLNSISDNFFYAPDAKKLNDPCETLVYSDKVKNQTKLLKRMFGAKVHDSLINLHDTLNKLVSSKKDIGIYSLSKTYKDELLWVHYADNHKGFCIEYDYDILMDKNSFYNLYSFDVVYSEHPPQIDLKDISSSNHELFIKKIAGTKSKRWSYEEEVRIITDKYGEHEYNYSAVKAIYFGLRMPESQKEEIMKRLAERELEYYQIMLMEKSYSFERQRIPDKFVSAQKYLFKIYRSENEIINYSIKELEHHKPFKKGSLSIILDSKISKDELESLGIELKNKLFRSAEKVFMFYYLKNDLIQNYAWGLTHFENSGKTVKINGLTSDEEAYFKKKLEKDNRFVIGHWIDETNLTSLVTIYEDTGKVFLEITFKDKTVLSKEQIVTNLKEGVKYQDIDDIHGEYIIVDKTGLLSFYSEDGVFNRIEKQHPIKKP